MSSDNSAEVYYDIKADTAGAINGFKKVESSSTSAAKGIDRVESSTKKLNTTTNRTTQAMREAQKQQAMVGRRAGQAGIQIQQLTGQIQGGTNAMLAFSQQSADLGIVLGAPLVGVAVSLAAALAMVLVPSIGDTRTEAEKLEETLESLDKIVKQSEQGVNVLSNEYYALAKASKAAAEVEVALGIVKAKQAIQEANAVVEEATKSWAGWFDVINVDEGVKALDKITESAKNSGKTQLEVLDNLNSGYNASIIGISALGDSVNEVANEYGIAREDALSFLQAVSQLDDTGSAESMEDLAAAINDIALNSGVSSKKFLEMAKSVNEATLSAKSAAEIMELLKGVIDGMDAPVAASSEAYNELTKSLNLQIEAVGKSKREISLLSAEANLGKDGWRKYGSEVTVLINKLYALKDATEEADRVSEQMRKHNMGEFSTAVSPIFDFNKGAGFGKEMEALIASENRAAASASPEFAIEFNTEKKLAELKAVYDTALISEQEYQAQRVSIISDSEAQIAELQEKRFREESEGNALVMDSLDSLGQASASAFSGILSGTMTAQEAMAAFAQTVLNQAIGALVDLGIQAIKNQLISNAAATASVGVAAVTGSAIAASYATPAYLASVATLGGAAVAGQAALTEGLVASKALVVGGRESGGSMNANTMYQMGEKNKPEVMVTDAGMFGVPGDKGKMYNQSQLSRIDGGGSGQSITQNISVSGTGDKDLIAAMGKAAEDGAKIAYNRINSDISNNGPTARNLRQNGNYTPNSNGR